MLVVVLLLNSIRVHLQECSNADSYQTIETSFAELAANISASNATLYAREATLKAAADEAHTAWLEAQAKYRTATAEKESAKQAATYAAGMYTKFETAVSAGQAQYDEEKPKLDEEMAQLNEELPVLQGECVSHQSVIYACTRKRERARVCFHAYVI
jgi:hypothetical protein